MKSAFKWSLAASVGVIALTAAIESAFGKSEHFSQTVAGLFGLALAVAAYVYFWTPMPMSEDKRTTRQLESLMVAATCLAAVLCGEWIVSLSIMTILAVIIQLYPNYENPEWGTWFRGFLAVGTLFLANALIFQNLWLVESVASVAPISVLLLGMACAIAVILSPPYEEPVPEPALDVWDMLEGVHSDV